MRSPNSRRGRRKVAAALLATSLSLVAVALSAEPAWAQSFTMEEARFEGRVDGRGRMHVTESLTYSFEGGFSGAFREIRLRPGERIEDIQVSEDGRQYSPGASAELGSSGPPDSYGVAQTGTGVRVVWHYSAANELRTFDVSYVVSGLVMVHDDVTDVNVQVWGDEWDVGLARLSASITLPGVAPGEVRVFGHPATVDGFTELDERGAGASLGAVNIPGHQFVEMRILFPPQLLEDTSGAKVVPGDALNDILATERAAQQDALREKQQREWFLSNLPWLLAIVLVLVVATAVGVPFFIYYRYGREPRVPPGPQYVFEPPGEEPPALISALLEPGGDRAPGSAFTATLFDLIRRDHIEAIPVQTIKKTWGGLREQDVSDLALRPIGTSSTDLSPFDMEVMTTVEHAAKEHSLRSATDASPIGRALLLGELRDEIKEDPAYYQKRFAKFKEGVLDAIRARGWWLGEGFKPAMILSGLAWAGFVASLIAAIVTIDPLDIFPLHTIALGVLAGFFAINAFVLSGFMFVRRGWERRSEAAARSASQWIAFRNFLSDFAGMKEAVPGSIEIWERFLCYGIAFGVADRVLAAAQLRAPPELDDHSSVFWIAAHGPPGHGVTAFAIADIGHAMSHAAAPSSGGGGGFSGGGGGGGLGGGGGAW